MTVYFDENMPPIFAEGFQKLQAQLVKKKFPGKTIEVKSLPKEFGRGLSDEEWIPKVGGPENCVITQDYSIRSNPHQWVICKEHKVNMIFVRPPKKGLEYWEMVKLVVKYWPEILEKFVTSIKPFAYRVSMNSTKLVKVSS
jgi:hypothetical protein